MVSQWRRRASAGDVWRWLGRVSKPVDLREPEQDHGLRNAKIALGSAMGLGALYGVQVWRLDLHQPYVPSYVAVDAAVAFVLTPMIVSVYLSIADLMRRLLGRLVADGVIRPLSCDELYAAAPELEWLNHKRLVLPAAILAGLYFPYVLLDSHRHLASPTGRLVVAITSCQAVLLYLAVVAVFHLLIVSRAVGKLLRLPVHVQTLHPDRCGGLWIVGRIFNLLLSVAAGFGGVGMCILLALHWTPIGPARRPEPYLLAAFYAGLLPSAFLNLLWRPHQLLEQHRRELLKPLAYAFEARVPPRELKPFEDNTTQVKTAADFLVEISRLRNVLDEACPTWPVHVGRLRPVIATAILPVVIPLMTAVIGKFILG